MRNISAWVLIMCLLAGVQACEPEAITPIDEVSDQSTSTLFDSEWILIDYKNNWLPTNLKNKASIKFQSGTDDVHLTTGKSFVNSYSGSFKFDEKQKLVTSVDNIISTLMGGTPEQNAAEEAYFENLKDVKSYDVVGDYLTLHFHNKEVGYFVRKK